MELQVMWLLTSAFLTISPRRFFAALSWGHAPQFSPKLHFVFRIVGLLQVVGMLHLLLLGRHL